MTLLRAAGAEAVGTALLVAAVIGSGIMGERLSAGIDALALLGNTLATAAMLLVLIRVFAPVSGAQFNPVVTVLMMVRGEFATWRVPYYLVAQFAGAVAGAALANVMFGLPAMHFSEHVRAGAGQAASEAVATFVLLLAIVGMRGSSPSSVAAVVASTIAAGYWFTASTSFANPAVTMARMLSDTFAGIAPSSVPMFIAAQCAGTVAAAIAGRWLWPERTTPPAG